MCASLIVLHLRCCCCCCCLPSLTVSHQSRHHYGNHFRLQWYLLSHSAKNKCVCVCVLGWHWGDCCEQAHCWPCGCPKLNCFVLHRHSSEKIISIFFIQYIDFYETLFRYTVTYSKKQADVLVLMLAL